jgi:hypothetical protein
LRRSVTQGATTAAPRAERATLDQRLNQVVDQVHRGAASRAAIRGGCAWRAACEVSGVHEQLIRQLWRTGRVLVLWAVLLMACRGDRDAMTESEQAASESELVQCSHDIQALERTKARPSRCASDSERSAGSHCDSESGTCVWECLSGTDCGPGNECTCRGTCKPAPAAVGFSLLSVAEPGCVKDPEELATLDQACFSAPCVCGSHCDQQRGRCEQPHREVQTEPG